MRLIVADTDADYARMLARAIRESDWRRKVTVVLAGGDDGAGLAVDIAHGDAVLADAASCRRLLEKGDGGAVVCLSEERDATEIELDGKTLPCLFKYQSVHDLMTRLMDRLAKPEWEAAKHGHAACRVVAVYSASGGTGKSTFAAGLAEWLAAAGKRAFYLNLERIPGFPGGTGDGSRRFARVLYHLRREEHDALLALASRHPDRDCDWFPPADHVDEWNEYREEDIRKLLSLLCSSGKWDVVVADCESALTELTRTVLCLADDIFWLEPDDETGMHKSAFALRMLEGPEGPAFGGIRHVVAVPSFGPRPCPDYAAALRALGVGGGDGDE